jgi:hypothetical protein
MTIVLGQPMTLSALVDRHWLHWHFDRPYAAARPSYPRPRQPSHLAGPCDRERTQQSDGRRHYMPGLGVGDQPRECPDNPRRADYISRCNYAWRHACRCEQPHGSARSDARRLLAAHTAQCIWIAARLRTWLDDRSNVCPARVGVWPRNGLSSHRSSRGQSNTHTAVIHLAAANYAGSQPADGRMPDAEWRHARRVVPNLVEMHFHLMCESSLPTKAHD